VSRRAGGARAHLRQVPGHAAGPRPAQPGRALPDRHRDPDGRVRQLHAPLRGQPRLPRDRRHRRRGHTVARATASLLHDLAAQASGRAAGLSKTSS
jgi:hypothetical protein